MRRWRPPGLGSILGGQQHRECPCSGFLGQESASGKVLNCHTPFAWNGEMQLCIFPFLGSAAASLTSSLSWGPEIVMMIYRSIAFPTLDRVGAIERYCVFLHPAVWQWAGASFVHPLTCGGDGVCQPLCFPLLTAVLASSQMEQIKGSLN